MSCWCGKDTGIRSGTKYTKYIRDCPKEDVKLNLINEIISKYSAKNGIWDDIKGNLGSKFSASFQHNDQYQQLTNELNDLQKQVDEKEKIYLGKLTKLLILSQIHCEIKSEINEKFEEYGIDKLMKNYSEQNPDVKNSVSFNQD